MTSEDAYRIAVQRIAEAKAHDSERLSLSDLPALTALPVEIAELGNLQILGLENTHVDSLEPLESLIGLRELYLAGTNISQILALSRLRNLQVLDLDRTLVRDVSAISELFSLRKLDLRNTGVFDVSAISNLVSLEDLYLDMTNVENMGFLAHHSDFRELSLVATKIRDLRPLLTLASLDRLWFEDTPFAEANDELRALALFEPKKCASKTLEYLKTLPPWPEKPLPWHIASGIRGNALPLLPGTKPAPVMVRLDETGRIVPETPDATLEDVARARALQAWHALYHYFEDLAPLRLKVDNSMPALGRAFGSFERALGTDFNTLNEIDLGMQAVRLSALSAHADEALMEPDRSELATFTAQLSLYMQRFNSWIDYQHDAPARPIPEMVEDLQVFEEITERLAETGQVADEVARGLLDITSAAAHPEATPLEQKGALDSQANILDALSERALTEKRAMQNASGGLSKDLENASLGSAIGEMPLPAGLKGAAWALLYLYHNQDNLERLASRYPALNFITGVLRFLFPA